MGVEVGTGRLGRSVGGRSEWRVWWPERGGVKGIEVGGFQT